METNEAGHAVTAVLIPQRRAFVLSDSGRATIASVLAFSFALPIRILDVGGFEIPLAMLMVLAGLPVLFSLFRIPRGRLLLASAALALVSVCFWDLSPQSMNSFRPYFSYIFFFIPFVAYGSGYVLIHRREDLRRLISLAANIGAVAGIGIVATLVMAGLPVRIEGDLQGSFLGLPLYATHGVNTLAITEFVLFAFIWIDVLFQRASAWPLLALKLVGLVTLGALILLSLSRGATLSLGVFLIISLVVLAGRNPKKAAAVLVVLALGCAFIGIQYGELVSLAWSTRLDQTVNSASEGEVNDLTSGRLTLVSSALGDLGDNPLVGVGFTGFHEGKSAFTSDDALNSSPHDQYLTMLWKPGIPAGVLLFAFLFGCVGSMNRLRASETAEGTFVGLMCLTVAMLGIAAFTWDVLLVPNLGAMMMFLFGACTSIDERERTAVPQ